MHATPAQLKRQGLYKCRIAGPSQHAAEMLGDASTSVAGLDFADCIGLRLEHANAYHNERDYLPLWVELIRKHVSISNNTYSEDFRN